MKMNVYEMLFSAFFNILSLYVNVRVCKMLLPAKAEGRMNKWFVYTCVWLVNWVVYFFFNIQNLTSVSLLAGLFIATCLLFEGNVWKKAVVSVISLASGSIFENIVWEMSQRDLLPVGSDLAGGLCAVILEFVCILMVERYVRLDRYVRLPKAGYINILLLSIGSVILSELLVLPYRSDHLIFFGLSLLCLINVSTYFIYEKIAEAHHRKLEKLVMERQVEVCEKQVATAEQSRQQMRAVRHDMKNHLSLICIYLQKREYGKAIDYAERLGTHIGSGKTYVKSGNFVIDSILNYKLDCIGEEEKCELEVLVDVPEQLPISDVDLNIILSNLLDNSIEALEKTEEKYLGIEISYGRKTFHVYINNTYDGELHQEEHRLLSRKDSNEMHGIGLENVQNVISNYGGTMKIDAGTSIFRVMILIYI